MDSALRVAIASGIFSLAAVIATFGLPLLSKRRAVKHRETLHSVRQDADRLDGAFNRLERENTWLHVQLRELRTELNSVETMLKLEKDLHERTRDDCSEMKRVLQRLGHMPRSGDENGDPQ